MEQNKEKITCKYCSGSFSSLLKHISKTQCKERYSKEEMETLYQQAKQHHRMNTKAWKKDNKEALVAKNANYYQKYKEAMSEKNKVQHVTRGREQSINQIGNEKLNVELPMGADKNDPIKVTESTSYNLAIPATVVRKRPPINFTLEDLEAEADDDMDQEFIVKPEPNLSKKILPKRHCSENIVYNSE